MNKKIEQRKWMKKMGKEIGISKKIYEENWKRKWMQKMNKKNWIKKMNEKDWIKKTVRENEWRKWTKI